ncbi:SVEP1-like protein [Mya arenaria]|uniref:SVEP1-like protein n=1 Tax=Mya arenaria TaxID=6604 RepID=A0ABY7EHN7_MYAAR|nr:SVEP1-like protein [Mya arenaria]
MSNAMLVENCGTVPAVPHSTYTVPTNTLLGARVTYSCNYGYTVSGAKTIACLASGWATRPVCHPDCGTVPAVPNSTSTAPTNTLLGARVTYSCNSGYTSSGAGTIECLTSGWATRPACLPECGTVPAVPNSTYTTPTNTLLGARVTYSCNSGYTASGAETIKCLTSDVGYDCTDITCADPNAVCDGDALLCSCPTGFFDSNGVALGGTCEVKSTEVSAVLIAVPIACVVVVILAVTTACVFKQQRNRIEADQGKSNNRISERNAISLQTFVSEQDTIYENTELNVEAWNDYDEI